MRPLAVLRRALMFVTPSCLHTALPFMSQMMPSLAQLELRPIGVPGPSWCGGALLSVTRTGDLPRLQRLAMRRARCTVQELQALVERFPLMHTCSIPTVLRSSTLDTSAMEALMREHGRRLFSLVIETNVWGGHSDVPWLEVMTCSVRDFR
jgi:hypothetical protein